MRLAIGRFHAGRGQGFGCTDLAAGFLIADAAYERAELLRLADTPTVHQGEHAAEGFIANVFDGALVSQLVAQPGFQCGRQRGDQERAGFRIALLQPA